MASVGNKLFFLNLFAKNLQNTFTADAESVHRILEKRYAPEILSVVCVMLSYSVLSCQDTYCYMLHERQKIISMRINIRE
jgi:hypothetical protein